MFQLLGMNLPGGLTWVDKLVTGLLIGTGSAPMGDAGEGEAGAGREPALVQPEEALSDVQLTRRAERLISK